MVLIDNNYYNKKKWAQHLVSYTKKVLFGKLRVSKDNSALELQI